VLLTLHLLEGGSIQSKFPGPAFERTIRNCFCRVAASAKLVRRACVPWASVMPAVSYGLQMKIGTTLHTVTPVKPAMARAPAEKLLAPEALKNETGKIVAMVTGVTVTATNFASKSPVATVPVKPELAAGIAL